MDGREFDVNSREAIPQGINMKALASLQYYELQQLIVRLNSLSRSTADIRYGVRNPIIEDSKFPLNATIATPDQAPVANNPTAPPSTTVVQLACISVEPNIGPAQNAVPTRPTPIGGGPDTAPGGAARHTVSSTFSAVFSTHKGYGPIKSYPEVLKIVREEKQVEFKDTLGKLVFLPISEHPVLLIVVWGPS